MYGEHFDAKEYLRDATLMEDKFMNLCLNGNIPAVRAMLTRFLGRDITITKVETQKDLEGPGRSLRLDVWAEEGEFAIYNEEFQNESRGAEPRRLRYHCSMIDVNKLKPGADFSALPECWVIFITRHDVLGHGKTMYTINRYIEGINERFNDGQHLIYVNCAAKDDGSEVWKVIHDVMCKNPDEMLITEIAEVVTRYKRTEEGEREVDSYFDYFLKKEAAKVAVESEARGKAEGLTEAVLKLLKAGAMTVEKIAETFGMSVSDVQAIAGRSEA
ncbi:MAG: hypothetical protein IJR85_06115 [Synergistaceae bacterium]|nr:hypothetical protein [Synergistaceae bacterium]